MSQHAGKKKEASCAAGIDFAGMRSQFPAFQAYPEMVYLDSAATTLKPACLIEAMQEVMGKKYGTVHRSLYKLAAQATEQFESVRQKMSAWLGADEEAQIIFTRGTTDAINLVVYGLEPWLKEGDEIVVSSLEHHSNWVPWQRLCERKNLTFTILEIDPDHGIEEQSLPALSDHTRILALTHMPNTTGVLLDWRLLIQQAKALGAWVVMDGAQAMACGGYDLKSLGCDFYAFSMHKMYGPTGLGILWGKTSALEQLSPRDAGGEMVDEVGDFHTTFAPLPLRLEAGTPPIIEVLSLNPLIDWWQAFDFPSLLSHKISLAQKAKLILAQYPQMELLASHPQSSVVLFNIQQAHPMDVTTLLDLEGLCIRSGHMCAQPALRRWGKTHALRVSFGLYNDEKDLEALDRALCKVLKQLGV